MKIAAFDFDGTLADSFKLIQVCFIEALKENGLELSSDKLSEYYGPNEEGMMINLLGPDKAKNAFESYIVLYSKLHQKYLHDVVPGIRKVLDELYQNKVVMVLLTGRSRVTEEISINYLGLNKYFQKVYTGSPKGVNKPISLQKLVSDFHCSNEDVMYIGDTAQDIVSCKKVGIELLSVTFCHTEDPLILEKNNPGHICNTPEELQAKLNKWLAN